MKQRLTGSARVAAAAALVLAGCSSPADTPGERSSAPPAEPTATVTVTSPAEAQAPTGTPSNPTSATGTADCKLNPSSAPPVTVDPYQTVAAPGRISLALSDIAPGELAPGGAPVEVDVTMCNDSAVDYPNVGVVLVLGHCSCAPNPMSVPAGSVERFDDDSGTWVAVEHPTAGMGMDYLGGYSSVQALPKGQQMTLRYRIALDASMVTGEGVVEAAAVTPQPLNRIGTAEESFVVG